MTTKTLAALTLAAFVGLTGAASASSYGDIVAAKSALQDVQDPTVRTQVQSLIRDAQEQQNDNNRLEAARLAEEALRVADQG